MLEITSVVGISFGNERQDGAVFPTALLVSILGVFVYHVNKVVLM